MENFHLSKRSEFFSTALRIADLLGLTIISLIIYYFVFDTFALSGKHFLSIVILVILTLNIFSWLGVYRAWRGQSIYREIAHLSFSWTVVNLVAITMLFITTPNNNYSRIWVAGTFVGTYIILISYRIAFRLYIRRSNNVGFNEKRVVVVGAGSLGRRACNAMLKQRWAGLNPVAFFDDDPLLLGHNHKGIEIKGDISEVVPFIESRRKGLTESDKTIGAVWIALPLSAHKRIEELQNALLDTATNVYFIPDLFGFNLTSYSIDEVVGLPVMNMSATTMEGWRGFIKRLEDILVSGLLLFILLPIFLVVATLIKLESSGPIFFKQRRYGQDGKEFLVWKFRSMRVAEDGDDVVQAKKEDVRVTSVGKWLRKLSIDELPQLINVLEGSMSLIGPRPHAVAHNEFYRKKVSGYMARHKIRPGITGWAQVNGSRGETARISDMEKRIQYDLEYIRNWSIFLDLRILFMTIKTITNFRDTH